jgi:hypothetical protein
MVMKNWVVKDDDFFSEDFFKIPWSAGDFFSQI